MPLSGGTSGAHDDSMHQGSAKRDTVNGVAALNGTGSILGMGSTISLKRDGAGDIFFQERTSVEFVFKIHRIGSTNYELYVRSGGAFEKVQLANMKDVANGIAALDAAGSLLLPGSKMYYTRDGSDDVHIYERTSNEEAYAFHRVGADDYTFFVKESNVWKRMQTESMKDIADGIAGLDADVKVPSALMQFPLLAVSDFQTNAGTGTATNPARLNDASVAASVTYAVNGEYVEVLFSDYGLITQYRSYGHVNMAGDGRFKIQHKSDAAWIDNTLNIPTRGASWSGWVKLTKPVYTKGIRLVATALDTGMAGANLINEMEMIG